ncbi:MAG: M14 family zinc carboxypeptidase [Calditrichia bacterium]
MIKKYWILLIAVFVFQAAQASWRPDEKLVQVMVASQAEVQQILQEKFNVDELKQDKVSIYVVPAELERLKAMGYTPEVLIDNLEAWSAAFRANPEFATYHDYYNTLTLVDSLLLAYPNLIEKHIYGYTPQNKELYAVKISDNVSVDEPEPEISFDGCHHGDEIMGSEVIIRLMRDLCNQYGSDPQITGLVNSREVWIYPFINPDGRQVPSRYNSAGVDVNRDWGYMWDGEGGSTGPFSQPESQIARNWINENQFVISQTNHGGTESISYPWSYRPASCPDDAPIDFLAAGYSATSGYANLDYFQGYNGMYPINGSAKDAFYGVMGSVGWTTEVSYDKQPPASQINTYYGYNKPAMLYLIDMAGKGIKGMAMDAVSGAGVPAMVWASSGSNDFWPVYADPVVGDFHKFLLPGTYNLTFTANGYQPATVNNVVVVDTGATAVNVQLQPQVGSYAYRVVYCRIPGNNNSDEGNTPAALGAPDNVNYSIGRNGYVVLDMGESISDFPGNDLRVVEGDASAEGYTVKVSQQWTGPWQTVGIGNGTQDFDISSTGLSEFRYVRIEDDGDGSSVAADAGFDLDAVEGRLIPDNGPFVLATGYQINDSLSNNNGVLEAGETVAMGLNLQNLGVDPAQNVAVTISSNSSYITILSDSAWFGSLSSGGTGIVGSFTLAIDAATPNNSHLNLQVEITCDGGYIWSHPLDLFVRQGARIASNYNDINFPETFLNFPADIPLRITNNGSDSLLIHQFGTGTAAFWVTETSLAVAPGSHQEIMVHFLPIDTLLYLDTLQIASNDPVHLVYEIPLSGRGILAPDIQAALDSIAVQVQPTDSQVVNLGIENTGPGELIFTVQIGNYQPGGTAIEGAGGSDSFGHIWIDSDESNGPQYNWIELSTGLGTEIPLSGLNSTSNIIPLGFDVPFYNEAFSSLRVCNNGWISFTTNSVSYNNTALPSNLAPRAMIAPLWDNLYLQPDSKVFYLQEANRFIVQWEKLATATGFGPYTFELIIFDTGNLMLQYKTLTGLENSYTVGMQDGSASDGFHIAFNEPYLHEQMAIMINRRSWVSINPLGATLQPGAQTNLQVIFKTEDFPLSDFWASVEINSNDPDESQLVIPIHMVVDTVSSGIAGKEMLPAEYRLAQNYPNPFNPETVLEYQIPQAGEVRLEIYNVQGQRVRTLVNGWRAAGQYEVKWDGKGEQGLSAASGLYFYRLQAGEFISVKRMLLLK